MLFESESSILALEADFVDNWYFAIFEARTDPLVIRSQRVCGSELNPSCSSFVKINGRICDLWYA